MAIIHGASHKAIRFFREKPAALAVYWIYCSRQNKEGVAWAGLRGLEHSSEWNRATCAEGRAFLVEHGALEEVKGYVRPEWRKLPEKEMKRRLSLDKSEYYRPTGVFVINGTEYPMLYIPASEAAPELEAKDDDGLPGRTSPPSNVGRVEHRPDQPELDSLKALGSSSELGSFVSSPREQFKVFIPTPLIGKVDVLTFPSQVNAIFYAYLDVLADTRIARRPVAMLSVLWEDYREDAMGLAAAGITTEQLTEFVLHKYTGEGQRFYPTIDSPITLKTVSKEIKGWLSRKAKTSKPSSTSTPSFQPEPTPVQVSPAEAEADLEARLDAIIATLSLEPPAHYLPDKPEKERRFAWESLGRRFEAKRILNAGQANERSEPHDD